MIKELTSLQDDWCIKVRIVRLWKLMAFKNPLENWKIEMVLQYEEENKIVATVKESIYSKFEKYLEEGKCFYISTFSVGDSQGTPRIVENKNKIHFYNATNVTPCDSYSGSVHGFRFKSFDTLLQVEEQSSMSYDLIGDLISCGTIAHAMVDGNRRPYIRLELEDLTGTKLRNITLWGDYALQLNNTLGKPAVSNMFDVSKLFINDDIPDIRNFKQKLIENRSHEGDDHCVTHLTTFSSYFIKNDFLNNLPKVCINDIRDIGKAMSCVVVATVKKIERESDWWYKIPLRVMDSTGSVSLTLFDRQAQPIIGKSAAELLRKTCTFTPLTLTNSLKTPMLSKLEIQSNSQNSALELMSLPSGNKLAMDVLSVTGDNMALRDDEKSTTSSPGKSKLLNVIDVDNDPLFSSIKKKLLSLKKEKENNIPILSFSEEARLRNLFIERDLTVSGFIGNTNGGHRPGMTFIHPHEQIHHHFVQLGPAHRSPVPAEHQSHVLPQHLPAPWIPPYSHHEQMYHHLKRGVGVGGRLVGAKKDGFAMAVTGIYTKEVASALCLIIASTPVS
ncbi:nucleic acid-binding, OB-fold, replication protein A, OB domain protein [Tanacetum coccineum]|uniref:Nucleic acid-binding, OB-fold, replication protein A, OB domain protein n=1 Tax=Tanacetum coccineum TaxID=301880 RepID=A0ABQ5F294_9ASTR